MSYIAFLCVSIFREVFLECLPGVLVELGTIIVSESIEQSTPAHMVSSDVSNTWGINTGGGNIFKHSFPCHTEWIYCPRYRKLIRKGELKKHLQQLVFSLYSESIRLYSEWRTSRKTCSLTPVLLGSIRLSDIPVDLFDSRLPTNSFYLVYEQLGSLFLDLLHWNISQTRQHSWKDFAPPPPLPYWKNMTPLLSCLNRIHALQQYAFEMNLS